MDDPLLSGDPAASGAEGTHLGITKLLQFLESGADGGGAVWGLLFKVLEVDAPVVGLGHDVDHNALCLVGQASVCGKGVVYGGEAVGTVGKSYDGHGILGLEWAMAGRYCYLPAVDKIRIGFQ
ncbi:hypothetical protein V6R21_24645 [Limibacter armeniacum]|uniref:hypothetical protein n=1 Tax=Limibacter armeniacum TaxID=466084 RepID=UPI002FE58192